MASIHNEVRHGTLSDSVTRALGVTRQGGVERFSETLQPIINTWGMPEWAYLRQERLCAGFATAVVDAVNFSNVQLYNPAGSGYLIVVDEVIVRAPVLGGFTLDETTTAIGAVQAGQSSVRDSRWRSNLVVGVIRQGATAGVTGIPMLFFQVQSNSDRSVSGPFVIGPGASIYVRGAAANLGVSASFYWRERKVYPGELV